MAERSRLATAARITSATCFGCDSIGTWLVCSTVVVALIFLANACSSSGAIMRSLPATM